jgi:tetratricopeptide (TPR) repeat protein
MPAPQLTDGSPQRIGYRWCSACDRAIRDWAISEQIAVAASGRLGDRAAQAFAYQRLGIARARLGRYQDAYAHLEHALSIYNEAPAAWEEALAILDDLHHFDAADVRAKLAGLAAAPGG